MNSERIIHRIARRRKDEYTALTGAVPYEVFRAAAHSPDQAATEFDRHVIAVERLATLAARDPNA